MADGSVAYGSLPFKEQIAFFRAKKNVLTESWTDVWEAEHDHAFMVAGANRIDLLTDLRGAVDKAIAQGSTLATFRKDFDGIVAKYGWDHTGGRNWRSRVIYETNLRTSYAAGRWAQLQALVKVRPYWRYVHSDSVQHPRPLHLAWNGLVLLASDPWWLRHFGPNGWGCQCTVEALNQRDLKRLGKEGPDSAPAEDMQTVVVGKNGPNPATVETPAGVDPGFGYAPGRSAFDQLVQTVVTKATQLPARAGAEALAEPLALPRAQQAIETGYAVFQEQVTAGTVPAGATQAVGALEADVVTALAEQGIEPSVAPIVATQARVATVLDAGMRSAVASTDLVQLPAIIRNAQAVLLVTGPQPSLIYVAAGTGDARLTASVAVGTDSGTPNTFSFMPRATLDQLRGDVSAGRLVLLKGSLD
jgi:hypothetical protein